ESARASVLHACLLDRVEGAKAGIASGSKNYVRAFPNLGERDLLAFPRIVPGGIGDAHVVLHHLDLRVDGARALLKSPGESMNEADIHAAEKPERAGPRRSRGNHADEIRPFVLLEDEGRDVRQLTHAVDDAEMDVGIVACDDLHDRRLREPDADNE